MWLCWIVISGTLPSLSPPGYDSVESSPCHSLWSRNIVPYLTIHEESVCIWPLTIGVCGIYYAFPGGPTVVMKRSADVLISHHLHTSSISPALSSLVTSHTITRADPSMDHNRACMTCVAPLPTDWNRRLAQLHHPWLRTVNPIQHHSALVWQLPIVERRIVKHGAHSYEWQRPALDKPHDDDDDDVLLNRAGPLAAVCQKDGTVLFVCNFTKCRPIFKILLPSDTVANL